MRRVAQTVGIDQAQTAVEHGEHAEAQQVDLDDAQTRQVVLVPGHHGAVLHGRGLHGHEVRERRAGDDHAAHVDGQMSRQPAQPGDELDQVRHARVASEAAPSRRQLALHVRIEAPVDALGQAVHFGAGEAQGLAHVAHGRTRAPGDGLGGQGRVVTPVATVDVLQDTLAVLVGDVEVDVRHFAALVGQEALEQQLHAHGIDRGDAQGVADRRVGRRPAPLAEDALALTERHDVMHHQEVPGQVEALDHVEFLGQLTCHRRGERSVATPCASVSQIVQP